jgi:hypothetical protein
LDFTKALKGKISELRMWFDFCDSSVETFVARWCPSWIDGVYIGQKQTGSIWRLMPKLSILSGYLPMRQSLIRLSRYGTTLSIVIRQTWHPKIWKNLTSWSVPLLAVTEIRHNFFGAFSEQQGWFFDFRNKEFVPLIKQE